MDNIEQYRLDFENDFNANQEQRDKSNEELRFFMVQGGQWEDYLSGTYSQRARLEVDQVSDHLWRTYSSWCMNRLIPNYTAADPLTTKDDAVVLDGLLRRDIRNNSGQSAIDTAVREAMQCGYGAFMLNTEYADPSDPENTHQNVVLTETTNAYSNVVFDEAALKADKSDARRCTVLTPFSKETFEEEFPGFLATSAVTPRNRSYFNWNTRQMVYVGTRYHIEREKKMVNVWSNAERAGMRGEEERIVLIEGREKGNQMEINHLLRQGYKWLRKKTIIDTYILKTVFNGVDVLEQSRCITGRYIPVIPVYGYRGAVDGVEYFYGLGRKRMDAQRVLNMTFSLAAESASTASEEKPIFVPEQVQSAAIKQQWGQNRHSVPYLLAEPYRDPVTSETVYGPVGSVPGTQLAPAIIDLISMAGAHIVQGTGGAPQDTVDPDASGKAINAIIKRVDQNVQFIFDNIGISMKHFGSVYLEMAKTVYGGQANAGRHINIVNERDETQSIQLVQRGAKDGKLRIMNDPSNGTFEVIVDVSKAYLTEAEEAFDALKDMIMAMAPDDPLRRKLLLELIRLSPVSGLNRLKEEIRMIQLQEGSTPETDEELQLVQEMAEQRAQAGPTQEEQLMQALALKEETQAQRNIAELENIKTQSIKNLADARKKHVESLEIQRESRIPTPDFPAPQQISLVPPTQPGGG